MKTHYSAWRDIIYVLCFALGLVALVRVALAFIL